MSEVMPKTFENIENSLTPLRRITLMKRELARDKIAKRFREKQLALQAGLRKLLHPADPRHVIEPGEYTDDLRGLINPDGSIHLWPMGEMTHRSRAVKYNLLDSAGYEGIHFYWYLGRDEPSQLYDEDLADALVILRHHGVTGDIVSSHKWQEPDYGPSPVEPHWVNPPDAWDDDPWQDDFEPYHLPSPYSDGPQDAGDPDILAPLDHIPATPPTWDVVTADQRTFVASGCGYFAGSYSKGWTFDQAVHQAAKRNRVAQENGWSVRYSVEVYNPKW